MKPQSPPEKVRAAMPGTLVDLAERTGYPIETVLRQITNLRRSGVRVNAQKDGFSRNGGKFLLQGEDRHPPTTVFSVQDGTTEHADSVDSSW